MINNILKIYSFTSVYIKKTCKKKDLGASKGKTKQWNTCSEQDMGERGRLHQILLPPIWQLQHNANANPEYRKHSYLLASPTPSVLRLFNIPRSIKTFVLIFKIKLSLVHSLWTWKIWWKLLLPERSSRDLTFVPQSEVWTIEQFNEISHFKSTLKVKYKQRHIPRWAI